MTTLILAFAFLSLSVAGIVVRKTYNYVPLQEMRRLAHKKDELAQALYPAAAYEASLRILLGLWIAITGAVGLVLLSRIAPLALSIVGVSLLLVFSFAFIPSRVTSPMGERLTIAASPAIVWVLGYLYPLLNRSARMLRRRFAMATHTGLFERQDFIDIIERQQSQYDNRLTTEELEIAKRALTFDEHTVKDIFTPRKKVTTVLTDDVLGPILIDELHKSSQQQVLVRESKKGPFLGTLDFGHLDLRHTGKVSDVMSKKVYYVHEDDSLSDALHAFFVTNHPIFIVVNEAEEYLGILTVENILRQLLGHIPGDKFDRYTDISAVAARHRPTEPVKSDSPTEKKVVE